MTLLDFIHSMNLLMMHVRLAADLVVISAGTIEAYVIPGEDMA